jgi:DNA polymerase III alpha subunit
LYPAAEKFTTKIASLNKATGTVHLSGVVRATSGLTTFPRTNAVDGKIMRVTLADDSGQVTVVVWNEKAVELQALRANSRLLLINVRVKEAQSGGVEVHVGSNTYINVQTDRAL